MSDQATQNVRIAYIISAYKYPELLARIVSRLSDEDSDFFIHIDKKVKSQPFLSALRDTQQSNIFLVKRQKCYWAEFGLVQAFLNAIKLIHQQSRPYDYIFAISAQDYPIKSNQYIHEFLGQNLGKIFMSYTPMPVLDWNWEADGGMGRLDKYYYRFRGELRVFPPLKPPTSFRGKVFQRVLGLYFVLPRQFPKNLRPYAGSTWWTIPSKAAEFILDFLDHRPDVLKFFKHVRMPDEIFFQTILCNSTNPAIRDHLINNDLRFIDWSQKDLLGGHPVTLTKDHYAALRGSSHLFARKFDHQIDEDVLDLIDQEILLRTH